MKYGKITLVIMVLALIIATVPAFAGGIPQGIGTTGTGWVSDWGTNGLLKTGYLPQQWYHIYSVDPVTGSETYLCPGANGTWSPGGDKIAYWESMGTLDESYFNEYSLSIYDCAIGQSYRTGVVTNDFQGRINWAADNKIRFSWADDYISALGTYWEEEGSRYWTQGLAGGPHDVMSPYWTPDGILFGREDIGIQRLNPDSTITTIVNQVDPYLSLGYAQTWNGLVVCADVSHIFIDGIECFDGTRPVIDPSGKMIAHTSPGGWKIDAMPPTPTVPEPASLLALGTGLIGAIGFGLKRRR